jgi:hypothetical protein
LLSAEGKKYVSLIDFLRCHIKNFVSQVRMPD